MLNEVKEEEEKVKKTTYNQKKYISMEIQNLKRNQKSSGAEKHKN